MWADAVNKPSMRTAYHEALDAARLNVVRLGALAGDAVRSAVSALERHDSELAARVIAGDDAIDDLRRRVEAASIELLWRQQPMAGELRAVAAMLEIGTDLERIGDYAVSIAKNAIKLTDVAMRPASVEIGLIASIAQSMVEQTMRAYSEGDVDLAEAVIQRDDDVDRLYHRGIEALQEEMQSDSAIVKAGTLMLFVLTTLERVGDRAQNIAWHTKEMIGAE